jgi:hypothetical protein
MDMAHDHSAHDMAANHDRNAGHSVAMLRDKFWLGLALTVPVVFWSGDPRRWLGYTAATFPGSALNPPVFGTVAFLYGGIVFRRSARTELADCQPASDDLDLARDRRRIRYDLGRHVRLCSRSRSGGRSRPSSRSPSSAVAWRCVAFA